MHILPVRIAKRYLFARKSHHVINIISAISVGGIAVGAAALVLIMSVYNGFEQLIQSSIGSVDPDIRITAAKGKTFSPAAMPQREALYDLEAIEHISETLEENVYAVYGPMQTIVRAKGIEKESEALLYSLFHHVYGVAELDLGQDQRVGIANGVAGRLGGIYLQNRQRLELYFPSRLHTISLAHPAESVRSISLHPSNVFTAGSEVDNSWVLLPIDRLRELLEYEDEVSALEIRLRAGASSEECLRQIQALLGSAYRVQDRISQNEGLFKMMKYEKLAIFMILFFVVIIIAFSVFGCLNMLIIEKQSDIETLRSLGMTRRQLRAIFRWEGWMIVLLGMLIGMITGSALACAQERLGLLKMPGSLAQTAYPVALHLQDLVIILVGISLAGYLIAYFSSRSLEHETQ